MQNNTQVDTQEDSRKEHVELHTEMSRYYLKLLRSDKPVKASELDSARRFLKDNGITLAKLEEDRNAQELEDIDGLDLPFT